jgi:putative tricarboxylic transport membrane protein
VTFLIGFVIGPQLELSVRQSIIISDSDPAVLMNHPVALGMVLVILVTGALFMRSTR